MIKLLLKHDDEAIMVAVEIAIRDNPILMDSDSNLLFQALDQRRYAYAKRFNIVLKAFFDSIKDQNQKIFIL